MSSSLILIPTLALSSSRSMQIAGVGDSLTAVRGLHQLRLILLVLYVKELEPKLPKPSESTPPSPWLAGTVGDDSDEPLLPTTEHPRILDVVLNGYINTAIIGLLSNFWIAMDEPNLFVWRLLAFVLCVVQILFLGALFLMEVIYDLGTSISGGISLWRLIEHDYGGNSSSEPDGEAANLAPAIKTLYYLALLQGVLSCYRYYLSYAMNRLAKQVATDKGDISEWKVLHHYMSEIRTGCKKDPSFAKGRNLITSAIDMIGSNSPRDCVFGVNILYTAIFTIRRNEDKNDSVLYNAEWDNLTGQCMLMKHLVLSASSSGHILQKLLEMLDSRGLHDKETRNQAAMLVGKLAFNINLEQSPRWIEHISSLIGTFEQYTIAEPYQRDSLFDAYERNWGLRRYCVPRLKDSDNHELMKSYKDLLLQGLCILRKLAADENNCRVMSNTRDLVPKIIAPVTSDLLHYTTDDHGAWSDVVKESMEVIIQLTGALGETGAKLRIEISCHKEAMNTLHRILGCKKCNEGLQQRAIQILTQLCMYTNEGSRTTHFVGLEKESIEGFVRMLMDIFIDDNKSTSIRACSGRALSMLCYSGGNNSTILIQTRSGVGVDSLVKILLDEYTTTCRKKAAEILEFMCAHYVEDHQCLKLKKAMTDAMPKVIKIILYGDGTQTGKEGFAKPETDMEKQCVNRQGTGFSSSSTSRPQNDEKDKEENAMLSSLLSLCGTVYVMLNSKVGPDVVPQFHATIFLKKLKEIAVQKGDHPTVETLALLKAIAKMVISMLRYGGGRSGVKREDINNLIEALSGASKNMLDLDYSMIFGSTSRFETKLDKRTLSSLVKQAQELHASLPSTSGSG